MNEHIHELVERKSPDDVIIALVGNPNVGKSTVFNVLTGLNQHTGNWPGKTVDIAQGRYTYKGKGYILVDLPGTYSLLSQSEEERIAAEFILSGQADCTLVVADATCLERNLNLTLQVLELTDQAILCVNLLDEAERMKLQIDLHALECQLGIPVVGAAAGRGKGIGSLQETIRNLNDGFLSVHPKQLLSDSQEMMADWDQRQSDQVSELFSERAEEIARAAVVAPEKLRYPGFDRIVLGRWSGRFLMVGLLLLVFWLTIEGANYPSSLLQTIFNWLQLQLLSWTSSWPWWLSGILINGIFATSARVISVMLPPMAIFFPLVTFLEDLGYLPRAAFLMDHCFQRCGSCGKQVLTMSMGFGCNAAGVVGCRIISSPKERMLAIVTNALVPCNGRFPALIVLISLFFSQNSFAAAAILTSFVILGVGMTLLATKFLGATVFRRQESHFILELPPYRRPNLRRILVRSIMDRTLFVLGRAAAVAAPAGGILWLLQNLSFHGQSLLTFLASILEPVGTFLGMNGAVLLAFLLSFPANELLLPLTVMIMNGGIAEALEMGTEAMGNSLIENGWSWRMALCVMVFILFHWPCSTTCLTIRKETGSWNWVVVAILLPTFIGVFLCSMIARV